MNNIKGKKIFLIEDNAAIIDVYSMVFEAAGFDFEVMNLGKTALEKIKNVQEGKEEKPALVLLDLMLPDIGGFEILQAIRQHPTTRDIVVFILSNYTISPEQKAMPMQPDKFITKTDISPTQLVELIKSTI